VIDEKLATGLNQRFGKFPVPAPASQDNNPPSDEEQERMSHSYYKAQSMTKAERNGRAVMTLGRYRYATHAVIHKEDIVLSTTTTLD